MIPGNTESPTTVCAMQVRLPARHARAGAGGCGQGGHRATRAPAVRSRSSKLSRACTTPPPALPWLPLHALAPTTPCFPPTGGLQAHGQQGGRLRVAPRAPRRALLCGAEMVGCRGKGDGGLPPPPLLPPLPKALPRSPCSSALASLTLAALTLAAGAGRGSRWATGLSCSWTRGRTARACAWARTARGPRPTSGSPTCARTRCALRGESGGVARRSTAGAWGCRVPGLRRRAPVRGARWKQQPTFVARPPRLCTRLPQHMGVARVECRSGCACEPSRLDATWGRQVSLQQIHMFRASQHARCVVRVTVVDEKGEAKSDGHKVGAGRARGGAALESWRSMRGLQAAARRRWLRGCWSALAAWGRRQPRRRPPTLAPGAASSHPGNTNTVRTRTGVADGGDGHPVPHAPQRVRRPV